VVVTDYRLVNNRRSSFVAWKYPDHKPVFNNLNGSVMACPQQSIIFVLVAQINVKLASWQHCYRGLTTLLNLAVAIGLFVACNALADAQPRTIAQQVVERSGKQRGICAVLGGEPAVALEIARLSELLVHVRQPDRDLASDLVKLADNAGYGIDRLAVEKGPLDKLPYADRLIDVVVVPAMTSEILVDLSVEEILRVLCPGGSALIGASDLSGEVQRITKWARDGGADEVKVWNEQQGGWIQFSRPPLAGTDDWSHWQKGPDNNPVSNDENIRAPYMTQFLAGPYYIGMPSVTTAAGGRTFLAIGHIAHHRREWDILYTLIARNGFNGTELWRKKLPEGYLVHRSAFIATDHTFYMIDRDRCLMLDPETGQPRGVIQPSEVVGQWKWMAIHDNVLYFLCGKPDPAAETKKGDRPKGGWRWDDLSRAYYKRRMPHGFGDTLCAYDLKENKVLWIHKEEKLIDSRGMAMTDGRLFLYCPDLHLRSLLTKSGRVCWTQNEPQTLQLIEEPGKGLSSTPGFRTASMSVATPEALIIQGQTRMNVIAVATNDGSLLWTKKKITNNPNAIFVDENLILGVGPGGSHVALDPVSGEVRDDLQFKKFSCTRLTASIDSFFCRGEGTLRFDRQTKEVMVDGSARPACNDGVIPANGLLYIGPWQCDCNLSLLGFIGRCSADDFQFAHLATKRRFEPGPGDPRIVQPLSVNESDWSTYRSDNGRSASTTVSLPKKTKKRWEYNPYAECVPTAPTSAGGLVFFGGDDGRVRALDSASGELRWEFATPSPIKYPPTIWQDRAYFGCGDGYAYALEAATGRLLWRFRGAPVERHIHAYGSLSSTWPVQSGVLIDNGIAYFAAGIIDYDGTYVYALDATTGEIRWQNNSSGHLNPTLRKGISVQGNLTIQEGQLLMAGGNQVSPARFDIETGKCLSASLNDGHPKQNNGRFVGALDDEIAIVGGRVLYASPRNVSTRGYFEAVTGNRRYRMNYGGIPPAWNDRMVAMVNYRHGALTCWELAQVKTLLAQQADEKARRRGLVNSERDAVGWANELKRSDAIRWGYSLGQKKRFEVLSLAVSPQDVVAVLQHLEGDRAQPEWSLVALDGTTGELRNQHRFTNEPLPGGLLIDSQGRVVVMMLDGSVLCYGG